jgi:hypothetical protein
VTIFLEPPEATLVWRFLEEQGFTRTMREWMGVDFPYYVAPDTQIICVYFEGDAWRPWLPIFFVIMEYEPPMHVDDTADMDFMAAMPCPPLGEPWSEEVQREMVDLMEKCLRPPITAKKKRPPVIPPDSDGPDPD